MFKTLAIIIFFGVASVFAATQHFAHFTRMTHGTPHIQDQEQDQAQAYNQADVGVVVATGGAGRISAGLSIIKTYPEAKMLISGTGEGVEKSDLIRLIATTGQFDENRLQALMTCCVELDRMAVNTRGNAVESLKWAMKNDIATLIVVTSDFHMPRTMAEFTEVNDDRILIAHAVPTPWLKLDDKGRSQWWHSTDRMMLIGFEMVKYYTSAIRRI